MNNNDSDIINDQQQLSPNSSSNINYNAPTPTNSSVLSNSSNNVNSSNKKIKKRKFDDLSVENISDSETFPSK